MTIVTNERGKVIATMRGHHKDHLARPGRHATLVPGPGQRFHEVNVPDEYAKYDPEELHRRVRKHLPKSRRVRSPAAR